MMRYHSFRSLLLIVPVLLAGACSSNPNASYKSAASSAATADTMDAAASAAAPPRAAGAEDSVMALRSPERKLITTADIRCRVNDAYAATIRLESWTTAAGGLVSGSHITNEISETHTLAYKEDSLRQVQSYSTTAHLTLRIPIARVDSLLAEAASSAAFMNSRNVSLQDVTLQYLSNQIKSKAAALRENGNAARLARRTADAIQADNAAADRADTHIDQIIENKTLADEAAYATLEVELYQPLRIDAVIIPDLNRLMKPTLGQQLRQAWRDGCSGLSMLLVALLTIWPLLVIGLLVLFMVKYRFRSRIFPFLTPKSKPAGRI